MNNSSGAGALRTLIGTASIVAVLTLVSRLFGFGRWLGQATWIGAGAVGNAYASANQIPNVIFEIVAGGALASITVPLLAGALAEKLRTEANQLASALLTWTLTLLIPLGLLLFFTAQPVAAWLPVSVGSDVAMQNELAALFLRIFAVQIPFYGLAVVLGGILQADQRFAWPAIMPALSSAVTIAAYGLYGWLSEGNQLNSLAIQLLGWGTTAGVAALSLPLLIPVKRMGVELRLTWKMPREKIVQALRLGVFGIGSLLAAQGYMLATLFLTRWGGEVGTINIFQYSQAIYMLPYALFTFPVATVVFPRLARMCAEEKKLEAWQLSASSTAVISALSMLGTAGLIAVAPGMARIFAWNRPLPGLETAIVAVAPALVGYALLYHLSRVFIAFGQAKYSFFAAVIGWGAAALFSWFLILCMSTRRGDSVVTLVSLGIGNTMGMTLCGIYLLVVASKRYRGHTYPVIKSVVVMLPGVFMGIMGGRLTYGAVLSLELPAGALWGTLAAGIVVVVLNLPSIYIAVFSHWEHLSQDQILPGENLQQKLSATKEVSAPNAATLVESETENDENEGK